MSYEFNWHVLYSLIFLLAFFLWWVNKYRKKEIWLPALRLINTNRKNISKYILKTPPLLLFIPFFLISLISVLLLFKPSHIKYKKLKSINWHIFIDLSPSMSAHINIDNYRKILKNIWNQLKQKNANIYISSSKESDIYNFNDINELNNFLKSLDFHRHGVDLSLYIQKIIKNKDIKNILFFDDRNSNSWKNFNWRYLSKDLNLYRYDISNKNLKNNYFIKSINSISNKTLEIEVVRLNESKKSKGNIKIYSKNILLKEVEFIFHEHLKKINIKNIILDINKHKDLKFKLSINDDDQIALDNVYFKNFNHLIGKINIIKSSVSNNFLEDSAYQLSVVLKIMGGNVKIYPKFYNYLENKNFNIIITDSSYYDQDICKDIKFEKNQVYWFAPSFENNGFENMCRCISRFVSDIKSCDHVKNEDIFNSFLNDLDFKPFAASFFNSNIQSPIWYSFNKNILFVFFTFPLKPSNRISHVFFPKLIKNTLKWSIDFDKKKEKEINNLKNVSTIESLLNYTDEKKLPQKFQKWIYDSGLSDYPVKKIKDAYIYVKLIFYIFIVLFLFESVLSFVYYKLNSTKFRE